MILDILGILIAFCSVMLMFSLVVTAFIQFLQNNLKWRTAHLKLGLTALATHIFKINNSWVSQRSLNDSLLDLMRPTIKANRGGLFYQLFRNYERGHINDEEIKAVLTNLHQQSDCNTKPDLDALLNEADRFFARIETEMSSHFTRKTHFWSFIVAGIFVILFQLDTFSVLNKVSQDKAYRDSLVNQAQKQINKPYEDCRVFTQFENIQSCLISQQKNAALYGFTLLPKGESHFYKAGEQQSHKTIWQLLSFWIGMMISTIFISLGAPFWFNRIKTLIQLKDKLSKVSVK